MPFRRHSVTLQDICSEFLLGCKTTVVPSRNGSALLTIQVHSAKYKPCLSTWLF